MRGVRGLLAVTATVVVTAATAGDVGAAPAPFAVRVTVRVPSGDAEVKGVELSLKYPDGKLAIPEGAASSRVKLVRDDPEGDDALVAKQPAPGLVRVVYVQQPMVGTKLSDGPLVRVEFDVKGGVPPALDELGCDVTRASDANGLAVPGVSCAIESGR